MAHNAQPGLDQANVQAQKHASSPADKQRKPDDKRESSLLSPMALMALGLAGAATAAVNSQMTADEALPDVNAQGAVDAPVADVVVTEVGAGQGGEIGQQMVELIDAMLAEKTEVLVASAPLAAIADGAVELGDAAVAGVEVGVAEPVLLAQAGAVAVEAAAAPAAGTSAAAAGAAGAGATAAAATVGGVSMAAVIAGVVGVAAISSSSSSSSSPTPDTTSKDTTAPVAPTLALATDSGVSTDGITKVGTVNVTGLETGASWQYSLDGGTNWAMGTGTSFAVTGDGAKSILVRQTDLAGNVGANSSALTFMLDTAAPTTDVSQMSAVAGTKTITLTFNENIDPGNLPSTSSFSVTNGGSTNAVTAVSATGKVLTLTLANNLVAGPVNLNYVDGSGDDVKAVQDIAGNDTAGLTTGTVADGYISGAQIYIDTNKNGVADASEKLEGIVTDNNGNFFLSDSAPKGTIIALGGVNIDTKLANTLQLKAPEGATTINPLTTLVQAVIDAAPSSSPVNATDAASKVAVALGLTLPTGTSLTAYDPLSDASASGLTAQKAAAQVATVLTLAGSAASTVAENYASQIGSATGAIDVTSSTAVANLFKSSDLSSSLVSTEVLNKVQSAVEIIKAAETLGDVSDAQKAFLDTADTTAPVAPGLSLAIDSGLATDKVTNSAEVKLAGLEPGATWEYSLDAGTSWTAGAGTNVTLTGDGAKSVTVRQTDVAGNTSAASNALAFTLDSTAAAAPTVALATNSGLSTDSITNVGTIDVTGVETGATWEYSLAGTTGWTTTAPTATEGSNTVYVRQTDVAGNTSPASNALSFTLDTTAPTAVISEPSAVPNSTTGALNFGFTFSEAVTGFDASDIAVVNGTAGAFTTTDASNYSIAVTPTSSTAPINFTLNVAGGAATDVAGNASASAAEFLKSVLFGTANNDTLTVGAAQDQIFLGAGADVVKLTSTTHSTVALPDHVIDFAQGDKVDLTSLLGTGGSAYTGSALGDSGAGFVELKNVTLSQNVVNSTTLVKFDVHFDAAAIGVSGVNGAVLDLIYDYPAVLAAQAVSPTFVDPLFGGSTNVWSNVVGNLSGATANGKIALTADLTAGNPIIDATGKALSVTLIVSGLVNTFNVGLEAVANGGSTAITTADNVTHNVDVGIAKTAGLTIGATGILEIITDNATLGTVGDNQLHMVSTYNSTDNTTHLQVQYDTNSAVGTTALSDIIALNFDGDVTANLTPAHLNFI